MKSTVIPGSSLVFSKRMYFIEGSLWRDGLKGVEFSITTVGFKDPPNMDRGMEPLDLAIMNMTQAFTQTVTALQSGASCIPPEAVVDLYRKIETLVTVA